MEQSTRIFSLGYRTAKQAAPRVVKSPIVTGANTLQRRALSSQAVFRETRSSSTSIHKSVSRSTTTSSLTSVPSRVRIQASATTPSVSRLAQFRHYASTTANPTSTANTTPSSASSTTDSPQTLIDWPTFFRLRNIRRRYSFISSIFTSLVTVSASITLVTSTPLSDTITSLSPLPDPFITLGLFTFVAFGLGWLIGPSIGQTLWRWSHRSKVEGFMAREKDFFERVKKYRVDPRGASAQNPVPDYYGERVGSRDQWRTWLKDQRAFNRKREGRGTGMGGGVGFRGKGPSE